MTENQSSPAGTTLAAIAARFDCIGQILSIDPHGKGLINDTFLVTTTDARYILQRINRHVFPHPRRIMANLERIAAHIAARPGADVRLPELIAPVDPTRGYVEQDGHIWRMTEFVAGARVIEKIENASQGRRLGQALGAFHFALHDLAPDEIAISLPGFHLTPDYLERFDQILRDNDGVDQGETMRRCIGAVDSRRTLAAALEEPRQNARLPERVVHGDPKIDNVLFDATGEQVLSIIDLDTVQPGLIHHDIGDCLRSCCNRRGEGATDPAEIRFDLDICYAILEGYARQMREVLTPTEIDLLFDGIRLMPYELGIRFLTDHLNGNRWFRVDYPKQNLDKALVQFALLAAIEAKEPEIRGIIAECFGSATARLTFRIPLP